jgi:hypothetical protein
MLNNALRYAAEQEQAEIGVALGAHDNEVHVLSPRRLEDLLDGVPPAGDALCLRFASMQSSQVSFGLHHSIS